MSIKVSEAILLLRQRTRGLRVSVSESLEVKTRRLRPIPSSCDTVGRSGTQEAHARDSAISGRKFELRYWTANKRAPREQNHGSRVSYDGSSEGRPSQPVHVLNSAFCRNAHGTFVGPQIVIDFAFCTIASPRRVLALFRQLGLYRFMGRVDQAGEAAIRPQAQRAY